MTDLEARLRASLFRVAEDTTIPDLDVTAQVDSSVGAGGHTPDGSHRPDGTVPVPAPRLGRRGLISVLAVAIGVIAVTVSIAVIQRETGGSSPAGTDHPTTVSQHGEIRGLLLISPPMSAEHVSSGSIVITGTRVFTITVGDSGRFTASVPPGNYTVIGHSPEYGGNEGDCITQSGPVTVRQHRTVSVRVRCLEK
jgi:hypothetical protein